MTEEQRYSDLISLGRTVRNLIPNIIEEIDSDPDTFGPAGLPLITWRVVLLIVIWDISDSALILAESRSNQIRAMRILNRSLFEYTTRLEFYINNYHAAAKDWINAELWLRGVVKAIGGEEVARFSKAERAAYTDMLRVHGTLEYHDLRSMLRHSFKSRGFHPRLVKSAVREAMRFYSISSSLSHGSAGIFYDVLEQRQPPLSAKRHYRSLRLTEIDTLIETVTFLIESLAVEQHHQRRSLGADMYGRNLELITGNWQSVFAPRK